jgi:hypothetical protein
MCPEPKPTAAEHLITDREPADRRTNSIDLTGHLAAQDPPLRTTHARD